MFLRRMIVVGVLISSAGSAHAHHEAIFGPQSSLLQTQKGFVSLQAFSRRQGSGAVSIQDTTALASLGLSPFRNLPLSFAATLPAAHETETGGHAHVGAEDALLGARYRLDLEPLRSALGSEDDFLMAVAGVELPTGTVHHDVFDRPPSYVGALLGSVEYGAFSAIGYGFGSFRSADSHGTREGHELFAGGGVAYAPIDSEHRLLCIQLGASYEYLFAERENGAAVANSAGGQVMLAPTAVLGLSEHWQIFAMTAFPVHQGRTGPEHRDRWRAGAGVIYAFGGDHVHEDHGHGSE